MQSDFDDLVRKAVKAAIALDWESAKEFNIKVLEQDPQNIDAKVRLGKAYLELRNYTKAKKCFKEVLAVDPINTVAKKNMELAKDEKHSVASASKPTSIIQEPATFIQAPAEIVAKGITAEKISMGVSLKIKVMAQVTKLIYTNKNQEVELALITDPKIVKKLRNGKNEGAEFTASFVKGTGKDIMVLINSTLPIFTGEKQELKPYTKRDFMDSDNEPEIRVEEN